jgi:hypothetical protein
MANSAGSRPFLSLCHLLKSWTEAAVWTGASSLYINQSWDINPDLFGLKIAKKLAIAYLTQIASTVSPPDSRNSSSESTYNVVGHFLHFSFSSLTALLTRFVQVINRVMSSNTLFTKSFVQLTFRSPGKHGGENAHLRHSSDRMG